VQARATGPTNRYQVVPELPVRHPRVQEQGGGELAAVALAAMPVPDTKTGRKRRVDHAVKGAAAFLGNTPAVCRRSYIDPRVFDRYRSGATIGAALRRAGSLEEAYMPSAQRRIERAVMRLISSP
jgi:DNA topoisomerase-1